MKITTFCSIVLLCCSFLPAGNAQNLSPQLRKLTPEQKFALLDYMRSRGGDIDREIQHLFDELPAADQEKTQMFLNLLGQAPDQIARTTVSWNRDTISYGKLEEGRILIDSFTVTNSGPNPYILRESRCSCDCTILNLPKNPIMPGESASIRVEFNSANKIGKARSGIVIYDNSEPNRRSILFLDGTVVPRKGAGKAPWE